MHELSIATSILELARRYVPEGAVLRSVTVRAGPMRGIEPTAMEWAWQAAVTGTGAEGSKIELELSPWRMRCPACGTEFDADAMPAACACGCDRAHPAGGDELQLLSIDVDEAEPDGECRVSSVR